MSDAHPGIADKEGASTAFREVISPVSSSISTVRRRRCSTSRAASSATRPEEFDRLNLIERAGPVYFRRRLPPWVELVKVPAQSCDDASPFGNEVFAMVDQKPELTFCAVEAGFGQIGLTQGRACDCERVDRIRLAVGAGAVADVRHQFKRDANYSFAGGDRIAFEAPAQVMAVLDSPRSITRLFSRPALQRQVVFACRTNRFRRQLPSRMIDPDGGVGACVRRSR